MLDTASLEARKAADTARPNNTWIKKKNLKSQFNLKWLGKNRKAQRSLLGSNAALRNVTLRNVALRNVALRQVELRKELRIYSANQACNYDKVGQLATLGTW